MGELHVEFFNVARGVKVINEIKLGV